MSNEPLVSDELKQFVEEVLTKNNISLQSKIEYGSGCEIGDGYTSKTFTVDVTNEEKSLHLFLKTPLGLAWHDKLPIIKLYQNETYFYDTIYPAYRSFVKEKGIEEGFRNVPECYGIRANFLALDNLKRKGYGLFPKGKIMNDDHILLAMRTFAKFHAISFALKDQRKELYDTFTKNIQLCRGELALVGGFDKLMVVDVRQFLKTLDPVEDKELLDASDKVIEVITHFLINVEKCSDEYSIITQGDCWSNNIMFLYGENNSDSPIDIMQVDWQLPRYGSLAIDLSYFFYPISSETTIEKYEYYLGEYYNELSKQIRRLGSDPEVLYPFTVLKDEWRRFAKFGLGMSFFIVKGLLMNKDEMPNLEAFPEFYDKVVNKGEDPKTFLPQMKNELLYLSRMKLIYKHFVKHNFL